MSFSFSSLSMGLSNIKITPPTIRATPIIQVLWNNFEMTPCRSNPAIAVGMNATITLGIRERLLQIVFQK